MKQRRWCAGVVRDVPELRALVEVVSRRGEIERCKARTSSGSRNLGALATTLDHHPKFTSVP
jgi:hypothetical protein